MISCASPPTLFFEYLKNRVCTNEALNMNEKKIQKFFMGWVGVTPVPQT